jgi:hypothetical protein
MPSKSDNDDVDEPPLLRPLSSLLLSFNILTRLHDAVFIFTEPFLLFS